GWWWGCHGSEMEVMRDGGVGSLVPPVCG
ncbi:hypothetical protein A2U01_0119014, partial [Trifolium medium]|nr:hypothetical protein [Trifolium medium]